MIVDSHCHLSYYTQEELCLILETCHHDRISMLLNISTELDDALKIIPYLNNSHIKVYHTVGVHPCNVMNYNPQDLYDKMLLYAANDDIIGFGETGLDLYHTQDNLHQQQIILDVHSQISSQFGKPLIIHSRNADQQTIDFLRKQDTQGVMHCFNGSIDLAKAALDADYYISYSGILTFKNAHSLRESVKFVPITKILVETDAPYLAPVPYRGQKNFPQYVKHVVEHIAELKNMEIQDVINSIYDNFCRLFKININKENNIA